MDETLNERAHWLDNYTRIAALQSPLTPSDFHEAIALWIVSTVLARRIVAPMAHGDIYPNLWVMLIAPSTIFAKTTAMAIGRRAVEDAAPEMLMPDMSTPEAMLDVLAAQGQRGYIVDEASGLMSIAQRDYMRGQLELLMRLYDCPQGYTRQTRQGKTQITAPYLTVLAASTPALMKQYLRDQKLWASGWWPRFALLTAPPRPLPFEHAVDVNGEWAHIVQPLQALLRRLDYTPANPGRVMFDREALDIWNDYDRWARYDGLLTLQDDMLRAAYGRSPAQALKIAMCIAAMDWSRSERAPRVTAAHMQQATDIARKWLQHTHAALETAEQGEGDRRADRVLALVADGGEEGVTLRELCRRTGLRASEVELILTELEATGQVRVEERKVSGGRQIVAYVTGEG